MDREKILREVQLAIQEELKDGAYVPALPEENESLAVIGVDSYDLVCISAAMEEKFGITISDDEMFDIDTVKDFVDTIEAKL